MLPWWILFHCWNILLPGWMLVLEGSTGSIPLLPRCPLSLQYSPARTDRASLLPPALLCSGEPAHQQLSRCCGENPAAAKSWQHSDCGDGCSRGEHCRRFTPTVSLVHVQTLSETEREREKENREKARKKTSKQINR